MFDGEGIDCAGSDEIFCAAAGPGNHVNVNTHCETFFRCLRGISTQVACGAGLRFDEKSDRCVEASKVRDLASPSHCPWLPCVTCTSSWRSQTASKALLVC